MENGKRSLAFLNSFPGYITVLCGAYIAVCTWAHLSRKNRLPPPAIREDEEQISR